MSSQLGDLWNALSADLSPDAEKMLLRLIKAHAALLRELVEAAEHMAHDRE